MIKKAIVLSYLYNAIIIPNSQKPFFVISKLRRKINTVTSGLFTHIVFTEKSRKDMRDRKDSRGTNYTYYISCFLILLLLKVDMGLFHF